jgi:hypothetical protein
MKPRFIALCGHPRSGKTLTAQILHDDYGYKFVDDGFPMRDFAMRHLGLTHDQVYTQEGKAEFVEILGRRWQVREILGELGNHLEAMFGAHIMPHMSFAGLPAGGHFVFGSVRRDQARTHKSRGGIVIGVANPLAPPSPYEFDRFDETIVDHWIVNNAQARGLSFNAGVADLREKIAGVMRILDA